MGKAYKQVKSYKYNYEPVPTGRDFRFLIPTSIWEKIYTMVHNIDVEVGAMISCQHDLEVSGDVLVQNIYQIPQEVSGVVCQWGGQALSDVQMKSYMDGTPINGWIHSHVNMSTGFSGQDDETIDNYMGSTGVKHAFNICVNKSNSMNGRIDVIVNSSLGTHVESIDSIECIIIPDDPDAPELKEIVEHLKTNVVKMPSYPNKYAKTTSKNGDKTAIPISNAYKEHIGAITCILMENEVSDYGIQQLIDMSDEEIVEEWCDLGYNKCYTFADLMEYELEMINGVDDD